MDRLTSMAVFVRVAELGSLAAAATEFDLSATMVGKHLRSLETRLGASLIRRTTRRQQLTEVGRMYFERCKSLLADLDAIEASADELQAAPRGILRVTVGITFGAHRLAPAIGDFMKRHPEVEVELSLSDRVVDLLEEGYDAAIRIGMPPDARLIARPLAPYRMLMCATPAYLAAHGTPTVPEDLARHECLRLNCGAPRDRWRLIARDGSERSTRVGGRLHINNGEALRQAALAGAGIVMQPEMLMADDVRAGRLVRLLPEYELPSYPINLIYLPDRRPTPKLQRFIEFAIERFAQPQAPIVTPALALRRAKPRRQATPRPSMQPIVSASKPAMVAKTRPRSA